MASLITGASGFLGSHLAKKIQASDLFLSLRQGSDIWRIKDINHSPIILDLSNYGEIKHFFQENKISKIFHLAAYGVYPTQQNLSEMLESNFTSTLNLIRAAKECGIEKFIYCGSGFEYGYTNNPISEDVPLSPQDPYSLTKAAASQLVLSEGKSNNLNYNVIRPFLVFGPKESSTRLIPTLISSYLHHFRPSLSSPKNVRDFIYVDDVVDALIKISNSNYHGEAFNIGSGRQHTVAQIDEEVRTIIGSRIHPTWDSDAKRVFEPRNWCADISKAKKLLNWSPKHSLNSGLSKTIGWFQKNSGASNERNTT